jgi:hypothetical protein
MIFECLLTGDSEPAVDPISTNIIGVKVIEAYINAIMKLWKTQVVVESIGVRIWRVKNYRRKLWRWRVSWRIKLY